MRKTLALILICAFLTGCSGSNDDMERILSLRAAVLAAPGCELDAVILADYGDKTQEFSVSCRSDAKGAVEFTVTAPETISGISGRIDDQKGSLTFDSKALAFSLLADEQLSPVSAPWVFLTALRGGYINSVGREGELLHCSIDDSYDEDALQLDVWLDASDLPVRAEIAYRGRRILSISVKSFRIL